MDNAELLQRLVQEEGSERAAAPESQEETTRYLVFHTEGARYALPSALVREVVIEAPKFFVPFVPPYVQGLINRHGEPYTALDLSMFLTQKRLEASTYLVLSLPGDQIALLITDVVEILRVGASEIRTLAASGEQEGYILGSFQLNDQEVLVLDVDAILSRLRSDVDRE